MADKLYWIDANGTETLFDTQTFKILNGMMGRFMPPIEFAEDEVPFEDGSRLREVIVKARDVDIPILIEATSAIELRQLVRSCLRMFNPLRGNGKWKVIAPDGSQRELSCRYKTGLEGQENRDVKGIWWQKLVLVFRAFDPYWYDAGTNVQTFTTGQAATFFPFFPLRLSSSTVFADTTIDNTGDVKTWTEWIVQGPGENIVLRNLTTRETIHLEDPDAYLGVGESITINTRLKTVTKNDGTNLYYTLADGSSLWTLQEGTNSIRIEMSNATSESSVQLSYRNRYWGA